jgi:hypothetical protein
MGMTGPSAATGFSDSFTVDRIAASFHDEIITLSDVDWFVAFRGFRIPEAPGDRQQIHREILDLLIDLEIIEKEAEIAPFLSVDEAQVDQFIEAYQRRLPTGESLDQKLLRMGISRSDFRELVRRDLVVNKFVKVRFEKFVVVSPREVREYYQGEFSADFRTNNQMIPPLTLVEENIRQILLNRKKNAQLEEWIRKARRQIEVNVLLFRNPLRSPNLPKTFRDEEKELKSFVIGDAKLEPH